MKRELHAVRLNGREVALFESQELAASYSRQCAGADVEGLLTHTVAKVIVGEAPTPELAVRRAMVLAGHLGECELCDAIVDLDEDEHMNCEDGLLCSRCMKHALRVCPGCGGTECPPDECKHGKRSG